MYGKNPVEKQRLGDGATLEVVDVFRTIQGEGPLSGRAAVFIRLAGCNLRCFFCDTDFLTGRETVTLDHLHYAVSQGDPKDIVVITGGEPLLQNIVPFCEALLRGGRTVQIETAGTVHVPGLRRLRGLWPTRFHVVCSPKTPKLDPDTVDCVTAWKYVLDPDDVSDDGLPMKSTQSDRPQRLYRLPAGDPRPIYVQPMDLQDEKANRRAIRRVVRSAMCHGHIASIQLHKYLELD